MGSSKREHCCENDIDRDAFEKSLRFNIAYLAKGLKNAGFTTEELDKFGEDVLKFIQDGAEKLTVNNVLETENVKNLIIMLLMHGAITSQKEAINEYAKKLGVTSERIKREMAKDTFGV